MASKKSSKKSSKQSTRQLPESQRTTPVSQRYYSSPSTSWYCLPVASDLATQGNIADADDNAIEGGNVSEHGSTTEDDSATEDDSDNGRSSSFGPLNQMGLPENQVYRLSDFPPYDDITRPGTKDQATQTDETKDQATQTDALVASSTSILIEDGNVSYNFTWASSITHFLLGKY